MVLLGSRVRSASVALAMAVIATLVTVTLTGPLALTAHASSSTHPACQASQIKVTAGATLLNATYDAMTPRGVVKAFANEVVPVYFKNLGATCHLLMGAPVFRAVKNTTDVATITVDDLSMPVGSDNENRVVVKRHQKVEALFVVIKPNTLMSGLCDPATTTGLLVGDYGNPIATTHFIHRKLRHVCFYSGTGRPEVNSGAVWVRTH